MVRYGWACVLYLHVTGWSNSGVASGFCLYQTLLVFLFVMLCRGVLLSYLFLPNKVHAALAWCHRAEHCRIEVPVILIWVAPSVLGPSALVPLVTTAVIPSAMIASTTTIISTATVVISSTSIVGGPYPPSIIMVGL